MMQLMKKGKKMRTLAGFQIKHLQNSIQSKAHQKGFTLIELLIVVAIMAFLAAISYPNYTAYVMRGKAAEATANLANLKIRMEQYFQDNKTYADMGGGIVAPCSPAAGAAQYFAYDCVVHDANTFTLRATSIAGRGIDNTSFTIDQSGAKTSTFNGETPSPNNCWLTKKEGSCS